MADSIAELPPDIIPMIADHLLADDPIDLISFRAVCRLFRSFSPNPRSFASLHRPRQWIMLSNGDGDLTTPRSFLSLSSLRSVQMSLPDLHGHSILSSVDGLLILLHNETWIVRVFNPFTRLLVDLPPLPLKYRLLFPNSSITDESAPSLISVAISSSDYPTVIISFQKRRLVLFSKPDDQRWVVFTRGCDFGRECNILFFQGRFYSTDYSGRVYSINLHQEEDKIIGLDLSKKKFIELVSRNLVPICDRVCRSYLLESNSTLLLVRQYSNREAKVYRVNPESKTVSLVNCIGDRALIVGPTRSLLISSKAFSCIRENSIYYGSGLLKGWVVRYSLENHDNIDVGVRKLMRPLTLVDHLITYCYHDRWARGLMYGDFGVVR